MRIACLLADGFEDSEFRVPYDGFRKAGHQVTVIGERKGQRVKGDKGRETVEIDLAIDQAQPERFDALFLPGGHSPDTLRADDRMVRFVQSFEQRPIFAICHGPQLLITAGMVAGRKMTAWKTVQVDLRNAGASVEDKQAVIDGQLVTSRSPADLDAFVRESLSLIDKGANAGVQA